MFLFFKGSTTVIVVPIIGVTGAVGTVLVTGVGVAGVTRATVIAVKAVTVTKGESRTGVKVTVFSRTRLLRFA